jgi:hypothetical protein
MELKGIYVKNSPFTFTGSEVDSVDGETGRSAVVGRQNQNAIQTSLKRSGKTGGDGNKVGRIPVWLAAMERRCNKDLENLEILKIVVR